MNPPQVYMCSPSWTLLPPPSPYHPSGSSQCTSPKHPVSCIEPGLASRFIHDILHVSIPFSQIFKTVHNCIRFAKYQNESATGINVFPILNPPPSSLPIPSLWVVQVHQPQASSIVHWTWAGDSFHVWHYTYFNTILPNHPTLSLSHRVQKTVLYISVSFAVSYTGLLLPSF